jgi:uncharacterized protein YndB with AHSA1/START domain
MTDTINNVSSQAVRKATGKTWDEWIAFLDEKGARDKTHKEIVNLLSTGHYIESAWWVQMVTVGYELAQGSRLVGETATAGFEIGVQKTIPISRQKTWKLITSPEGIKTWLGDVPNLRFKVGCRYETTDGTSGVIRSIKHGERIRLTWQPRGRANPATLQISLVPTGNKTSVRIHHERLVDEAERGQMREHWRETLERLNKLATRNV